jgi:hypothetical protein
MLKNRIAFGLVVLLLLFASCTPNPASTPLPTETQLPSPSETPIILTPTATETTAPTSTETPTPDTATPTATLTATQPSAGSGILSGYLDDRSTPSGLMLSYVNALNRKEYLRAYSYWENPQQDLGSYQQYQQGYQDTASVEAELGQISGDAGAGQYYYSVPVVLVARTTAGQTRTFAGCYVMHLGSPGTQAVPPFHPMGIRSATVEQADNSADHNRLLSGACPSTGGSPGPIPTTDPDTIASSNYLDDRSSAVDVLSSLFNAINRHEYARAYSYWQNPGSNPDLAPFSQFEQGYQQTASVEVTYGEVTSDVGAGQIRFRVPVTLVAQTTAGETQYFVGCYQLHLGQPTFQATPPFQPLGIERASVQQVTSQAEAAAQMDSVCVNMQ